MDYCCQTCNIIMVGDKKSTAPGFFTYFINKSWLFTSVGEFQGIIA